MREREAHVAKRYRHKRVWICAHTVTTYSFVSYFFIVIFCLTYQLVVCRFFSACFAGVQRCSFEAMGYSV